MKRFVFIGICFLFIGLLGTTAKAQSDCKNWMGRPGEKLCEKKASYDECVVKLKKGEFNFCALSGKPETFIRRISTAEAVTKLNAAGCTRKSDGGFTCSETADYNNCLSYKNFGAIRSCDITPPKASNGNIYLYAVGTDNAMWSNKSANGKWGGWQKEGGILSGGIDACSPNPGKIITMFRANDGATLWQAVFDYNQQAGASLSLYSKVSSDPTVTCAAGDKVWMYVRGAGNSAVYGTYAENGIWATLFDENVVGTGIPIEDVAAKAAAPVKESFWLKIAKTIGSGGERFVVQSDGILSAGSMGGAIKGNPESATVNGKPYVFVRGTDDYVWWNRWDGAKWSGWESIGKMNVSSDPTAVVKKNGNQIWLFARGNDNALWATQFNGSTWSPWLSWGGTLAGNPDATSWGGDRVDIFARSSDGKVLHAWREDDEALVKNPQWETVPDSLMLTAAQLTPKAQKSITIKNDVTAVGAKW